MGMEFTEAARRRIAEVCGTSAFRIAVEGGACQGFQYVFDVTDEVGGDDEVFDFGGSRAVVDRTSLAFLLGSTVDYVSSLAGERFDISNPNAASSCGCGVSFSI